jgi:hypothetical protein
LAVPVFIITLLFPFFTLLWIRNHKEVLDEPQWKDFYGTLTDNLDVESNTNAKYWNVF